MSALSVIVSHAVDLIGYLMPWLVDDLQVIWLIVKTKGGGAGG